MRRFAAALSARRWRWPAAAAATGCGRATSFVDERPGMQRER
jgi:hypothetical protein